MTKHISFTNTEPKKLKSQNKLLFAKILCFSNETILRLKNDSYFIKMQKKTL